MIYTVGYTGLPVEQLAQLVLRQQALLCDIRSSPHSRNPAYTQVALQARFRRRYRHVPALGNRHYRDKSRPIAIVDYHTGLQAIAELLQDWPAVILLCACADVQTCHRKGVGEQLAWDLGHRCVHQRLPRPSSTPQLTLPF
jgi:hypothetical protein